MIAALRRYFRLFRLSLHILISPLFGLAAMLSSRPERWAQYYFRGFINILNVKLHSHGDRQGAPLLVVGNHQSWLDITILASLKPLTFVSKAEVKGWPLIGWLATAGDTLYIERGAHGTADLNREISARLAERRCVVVFPEATTTRGPGVRRFQPRLFAGAIEQQCTILPFALRYQSPRVPYVDDQSLGENLWDILALREIHAEVLFGPPLEAGDSRNTIARRTQTWVEQRLQQPPHWSGHVSPPTNASHSQPA